MQIDNNICNRNEYQDIIHMPHHISKTRPQMDISDRAAQFSPFAALKGYEEAIEEKQKLAEENVDPLERERWYEI